ncbi:Carbon-nitrogen hydrolase [Scheffersomyces stipitis CBS 6054]|uniref:Carbon-nitrogen hydrolase n=1 Tax=Scheffersomyces stipitis (strain ATCC 58785 / CBS 6054 / NBRC 10063 / NRRL Y-11545) TaxID=322104 RepID=A3LRP9_PICST|nr:Carbon-nitrogen hydrolase [Scheffersomyces stipitis CBS 6054]ABN65423.1 Carbon-nitrogen hydrolase [Scheffersomyces stipitis CBS 6054]
MNKFARLRVACVQLNPRIGEVEANIRKVHTILVNVPKVDLVVLPELAITGYNFPNRRAIEPYLENLALENGPSIKLAKEISNKYKCFTLIGYPEISNSTIYNSAVLVGPNGSILHNYRKTFLYETDEVWGASENPEKGFSSLKLVLDKEYYLDKQANKTYPTVTTNIGICMDVNPYQFKAPFNAFEFSGSAFHQRAKLLLFPMAWLSPQSPSTKEDLTKSEKLNKGKIFNERYFSTEHKPTVNDNNVAPKLESNTLFVPTTPEGSTVNYWLLRFFPFMKHPNSYQSKYYETATLIACNRVGVEDDILYTGSSSIIQFSGTSSSAPQIDSANPSVNVLGSLGQGDEGVLVRDIDIEFD